jgi:hypothetical protein
MDLEIIMLSNNMNKPDSERQVSHVFLSYLEYESRRRAIGEEEGDQQEGGG